jgi:hypothetical protein
MEQIMTGVSARESWSHSGAAAATVRQIAIAKPQKHEHLRRASACTTLSGR